MSSELINNIFLTSMLICLLSIGWVKFRDDCFNVGDIEKYSVVIIFLISLVVFIISAFASIWI